MHAHFVLAHPEPQSFNAHLVGSGAAALGDRAGPSRSPISTPSASTRASAPRITATAPPRPASTPSSSSGARAGSLPKSSWTSWR